MNSIMSYFRTLAYYSMLCTYSVNIIAIQRYLRQIFRKNKTLNKLALCPVLQLLQIRFSVLNYKTISFMPTCFFRPKLVVYIFQISQIDTFFPIKGPIAGNTMLTIAGQNLHIGSNASVMIGQAPCDIQR